MIQECLTKFIAILEALRLQYAYAKKITVSWLKSKTRAKVYLWKNNLSSIPPLEPG